MSLGIIATGGTIAMQAEEASASHQPVLGGRDLLSGVIEYTGDVEYAEPYNSASEDVTMDKWGSLALTVREFIGRHESVIILHGTDTMTEGAFFLAETLRNPSIVITGAMRPSNAISADGPNNIKDSVTTALAKQNLGTCICMNSQVLPAYSAIKANTVALEAFSSRETARLAQVHDGALRLSSAPLKANWLGELPSEVDMERIGIITLAADPSVLQVEAVLRASDAVVIQALATGIVPRAVRDTILAAAKKMPVVLTSRTGAGPVEASETYPGTCDELREEGVIVENFLDTYKARIRLALSLSLGKNYRPFDLSL